MTIWRKKENMVSNFVKKETITTAPKTTAAYEVNILALDAQTNYPRAHLHLICISAGQLQCAETFRGRTPPPTLKTTCSLRRRLIARLGGRCTSDLIVRLRFRYAPHTRTHANTRRHASHRLRNKANSVKK